MITEKELIDPVEVEIHGKQFIIGHVPAFEADGMYDKIYENKGVAPEDVKLKLLSFVFAKTERGNVNLDKKVLIDEYVKPWAVFRKLVNKCIDVNFDFLEDGATSQV